MSQSLSVIVPCFNMGEFIEDTIQSLLIQTFSDFEIIIVDDGSTDKKTIDLLDNLLHPQIKLIRTTNQGLASARNTGVQNSNGKYILPLDADDKISESYIADAISILENDSSVGIVYGGIEYFGDSIPMKPIEKYDFNKMILYNQIYCSAFFRRSDFNQTQGYDTQMKYGWEDWDFWLSILELGREVKFINKPCFFYRIRLDSMVRSMTEEQRTYLRRKIYSKHPKLYEHLFTDPISLYYEMHYYKSEFDSNIGGKIFRKLKYILGLKL